MPRVELGLERELEPGLVPGLQPGLQPDPSRDSTLDLSWPGRRLELISILETKNLDSVQFLRGFTENGTFDPND